MKNAFTIDLEDWFCVYNMSTIIPRSEWEEYDIRVTESAHNILNVLDEFRVKATFFVLGWIAEREPALIADIHSRGHEIASHGYGHALLTDLTPKTFEDDLIKSLMVIQECTDQKVIGYRAPSFTITSKTQWAFDILAQHGIKYDSSIFPVGFHPDYGMADAPLGIHKSKNDIVEFPLSCVEIYRRRIPCCGGGYFRLFPYTLTKYLIKRCNAEGRPTIFYLHPWEVDREQPRVRLPWKKRFRHYHNLAKTLSRLRRLLTDFHFTTARGVLGL
jgi:polysaccharide deacetylase family protein (PEP-CTERM system associated)